MKLQTLILEEDRRIRAFILENINDIGEDPRLDNYDRQYIHPEPKSEYDFDDEVDGFYLNAGFVEEAMVKANINPRIAQIATVKIWEQLRAKKAPRGKVFNDDSKIGFSLSNIENELNTLDEMGNEPGLLNFYDTLKKMIWEEVEQEYTPEYE